MQPEKKPPLESESNPIFAYRSLHSAKKPSSPSPKDLFHRYQSSEKKQFHYPITYRNSSKQSDAFCPSHTVGVVKREETETTITTISDYTHLPTKHLKEGHNLNDQPLNNNYSTNNNDSKKVSKVFVRKRIPRSPTAPHHKDIPTKEDKRQNEYIINLEDLMMIEQKLRDIIESINHNALINNACFEWWNFYFNCTLNGTLEHFFPSANFKSIILSYTNIQFLSIMLLYDLSYDLKAFRTFAVNVKNLTQLLHKNFLVICDYILGRVKKEFASFVWVDKLKKLLTANEGYQISLMHTDDINFNSNCAYEYIRLILANYNSNGQVKSTLMKIFNNIKGYTATELNQIFLNEILRIANPKGSIIASCLSEDMKDNRVSVKPPYIKTPPTKPYTLVLDLDETLMNFKMSSTDETQGLMRLRPGLFDFLDSVARYYELCIFTAATKDYADPILNAIENGQTYFAYRFYREHTVIVKNDFVKDITRLGRDIGRTIIVDNMPQNFRLQKENGILILSFWGEDQDDIALFELEKILVQIYKDNTDVRLSIKKYKDDITKNVSSKIYQN